ncbi:MAG TPA: hypothetical protein VM286_09620 [Candidatus Thermoplasmatota archaeon]|nr:hypothetical protein [Candidatus Thermoplasmatota archaeon]
MNLSPVLAPEPELQAFLSTRDPTLALRLRTLAHAWTTAGGALLVGRHAVRLVGRGRAAPFTAGTLRVRDGHAELELSRVLLQGNGVSLEAWQAWCDERPELRTHGFAPSGKFPTVRLDALPDGSLARLAVGLRDLAHAVQAPRPVAPNA